MSAEFEVSYVPRFKPGDVLGGFEIGTLLGRGGMAEVYRAAEMVQDVRREIALKVMLPDSGFSTSIQRRFEQEARLFIQLQHPNILPVTTFGSDQGEFYIAMRLVDGGTLETYIREGNRLAAERVLFLLDRIGTALDYLHENKVIHRDLKPSNILIDRQGNPYVADFGIAKVMSGQGDGIMTSQMMLIGTPAYMSPEQLEHASDLDGRSDIFAMGIIVYQLLMGSLPFIPAKTNSPMYMAFMKRYLEDDLEVQAALTSQFGRAVARVVQKAILKDRNQRHQTCREFTEAFKQALMYPETVSRDQIFPQEPPAPLPTPQPQSQSQPATPPSYPRRPVLVKATGQHVEKSFTIKSGATPILPSICPVHNNPVHPANYTVKIRVGLQTQEVRYCEQHGRNYYRFGPQYIAIHVLLILLALVLAAALHPLLILPVAVGYWFLRHKISNTLPSEAHEVRSAIQLKRLPDVRIHWEISRAFYAQEFQNLNRGNIEGSNPQK